jgi:hypothetical protein
MGGEIGKTEDERFTTKALSHEGQEKSGNAETGSLDHSH